MAELSVISTGKTEAEAAKEMRAALKKELDKVCDILQLITAAGLSANYQLGQDAFGRHFVQHIIIVKPL